MTATAECCGLRPVANAFGCCEGIRYRRGTGIRARAEMSSTSATRSGASPGSSGRARLIRSAMRSENQNIAKLNASAIARKTTIPPVPPTRPPKATKSAESPASRIQVRVRVVMWRSIPFRLTCVVPVSRRFLPPPRRGGRRARGTSAVATCGRSDERARWGIVPPGSGRVRTLTERAFPSFPPVSSLREARAARPAVGRRRRPRSGPRAPAASGMRLQPGRRGAAHAPPLLAVDGADRAAVRGPGALLDLDEHEPPAAADDQVDLVPAGADVRRRGSGSRGAGSAAPRGALRGSRRGGLRVRSRLERAAVLRARAVRDARPACDSGVMYPTWDEKPYRG